MHIPEINKEVEIWDEEVRRYEKYYHSPGDDNRLEDFEHLIQLKIYRVLLEILKELKSK